ncbi:hypothetical protein HHI36_006498 [Cryptolaemus montrouzieri]|uniref:Uncharacterized protein n=1 Tax=Cryptolaemus montrouzieri TaxID=559131 RepID=A0ABD2NXG3_9CUCU
MDNGENLCAQKKEPEEIIDTKNEPDTNNSSRFHYFYLKLLKRKVEGSTWKKMQSEKAHLEKDEEEKKRIRKMTKILKKSETPKALQKKMLMKTRRTILEKSRNNPKKKTEPEVSSDPLSKNDHELDTSDPSSTKKIKYFALR